MTAAAGLVGAAPYNVTAAEIRAAPFAAAWKRPLDGQSRHRFRRSLPERRRAGERRRGPLLAAWRALCGDSQGDHRGLPPGDETDPPGPGTTRATLGGRGTRATAQRCLRHYSPIRSSVRPTTARFGSRSSRTRSCAATSAESTPLAAQPPRPRPMRGASRRHVERRERARAERQASLTLVVIAVGLTALILISLLFGSFLVSLLDALR